jgi:hypothetical protein
MVNTDLLSVQPAFSGTGDIPHDDILLQKTGMPV